MSRFLVIVLDGFGVGAMEDVGEVRPADLGSNTCLHIFGNVPNLALPTLERLGLRNIMGVDIGGLKNSDTAIFGRSKLKHIGADTFFGHQEIMGTNPQKPFSEPFRNKIDAVEKILLENGYALRRHSEGGQSLLVVNEVLTVADNIEADPGQAYNITSALDLIPFEEVLKVGELVRSVSLVPRVITFGGRGIDLERILSAVEIKGDYIGVNAPASGVYDKDYHCIHLGYGVNPDVQLPTILGREGVPVFLIGKVADVVINNFGASIPMVETPLVLKTMLELVQQNPTGFFCANVQETDLSGHGEDSGKYARILREADEGIRAIINSLNDDDILIVTADHGNDPTIGHPRHTREYVPLMIYSKKGTPKNIGTRETLSDTGATAAEFFGASAPENGRSYLSQIVG